MGSIMENRFKILITLIIFLSVNYTVLGLYNTTLDNEQLNIDDSQVQDTSDFDIFTIATDLGKLILLQIDGAPDILNGILGLGASIIWLTIGIIVATFIREMIGLT